MWILLLLLVFSNGMVIRSMELKSLTSCQMPLLINSKIVTSSSDFTSNTWCPSSFDHERYMLISFSNLTYIIHLNTTSNSSDVYYHLEYTREISIDVHTIWHSYRLLNNKQDNIQLNPPIIAKHIRLNIKQTQIDFCIQLEFFGCLFTDGVVSYSMLQGSNQLEDDTYDGQYNEKHRYLFDGLGQLSDGQTGPDNYQDPGGLQWVGWRKPRSGKSNYSIGILFKFDTLRNFSRLTIHANNYYPKKIYVFRSIIIEFLHNQNSSFLTYNQQRDDQFEMARPIMIDLKNQIASQIKIHLYFDSNWILISEVTFDSFIVPTTNLFLPEDDEQPLSIHFSIYIIIGVLTTTIILILTIILCLIRRLCIDHSKNKKRCFTPIHNQTDSSVSTTSSEIDVGSGYHRYATIQPYLVHNHGPHSSPHYAKLMPTTTTLLRSPASTQQNHIEGICGNSAYSTQRLFTFDLNQNQFISSQKIKIKNRVENRHQILGGGEIYQGDLQLNQSSIPVTIRRLLLNASVQSKISFLNEINLLTSLCHPNIVHAYGFCSEPSISLLTESFDQSSMDLYQYLQHYKHDKSIENTLYASTVFFATQISSALAYLESLHIYHRDIAARNCLVSFDLNIKLHDLSMSNEIYADDYVMITVSKDIQSRRPIRWCAWETICLNQFTSKSDVFSFGVLLWEMLTMAERPHSLLDDEQVLWNLQNFNHCLTIPTYADNLTDLIISCWKKYDYERPTFYQIHHLLNQMQQLLTMKSDNYQQID